MVAVWLKVVMATKLIFPAEWHRASQKMDILGWEKVGKEIGLRTDLVCKGKFVRMKDKLGPATSRQIFRGRL